MPRIRKWLWGTLAASFAGVLLWLTFQPDNPSPAPSETGVTLAKSEQKPQSHTPPASPGLISQAQAQAQPAPAAQPPAPPSAPARPVPPSPYERLNKMNIEGNYAGPLRDTLIQRLRDPVDGTICYLWLPISVPHGPPQEDGLVRYGANPIGAISCFPSPPAPVQANAQRPPAAPAPGPAAAAPPQPPRR